MAMTANTTIQLAVPDVLRGRVMAVYTTVFAGSTPLGGLAFGALAAVVGAALAVTSAGRSPSRSGSSVASGRGAGACCRRRTRGG